MNMFPKKKNYSAIMERGDLLDDDFVVSLMGSRVRDSWDAKQVSVCVCVWVCVCGCVWVSVCVYCVRDSWDAKQVCVCTRDMCLWIRMFVSKMRLG